MRRIHRLLLVPMLCVTFGCASAPPPTTYYLLRGEQIDRTDPVEVEIRAGIGRLLLAPYLLGSDGIMVETGPGEVHSAAQHQWAEPLDAGLRWYLRAQIGSLMGHHIGGGLTDRLHWDYTVDVLISRFHATMSGTALIEAAFIVTPTDESEERSKVLFSKTIPLPKEGYAGIVEAEKALARELAGLIAQALEERMAP